MKSTQDKIKYFQELKQVHQTALNKNFSDDPRKRVKETSYIKTYTHVIRKLKEWDENLSEAI